MTISGLAAVAVSVSGFGAAGSPAGRVPAVGASGRGCDAAGFSEMLSLLSTGVFGWGAGEGTGLAFSCFAGCTGEPLGSSFLAAAGCGAAGLRFPPERSILPTIFGPVRISSLALITPLLMTTSSSNSLSCARGESFLSCSDTLSGFRFIRSRTLTRSLALRLPPNSFARTA